MADEPALADGADPPILAGKAFDQPSVFTPSSLIEHARRQKDLRASDVPDVCLLDPDGDVVRTLEEAGSAHRDPSWPGYHTDLYRFTHDGIEFGIVGRAVGGAFAVLVAEQLFAAGCELLVSVTSAGQLSGERAPPYFLLIERAIRDEGPSYHYLPPGQPATLAPGLQAPIEETFDTRSMSITTGHTWTTAAPFRETPTAIERMAADGLVAVEMEAASLYAFAAARDRPVVCFAHVTNQLGQAEQEFEKGEAQGTAAALDVLSATAESWLNRA